MSAGIIRVCLVLFCFTAFISSHGQESKEELEKKRKELSERIAFTKELISKTKKGQQATSDELTILSSQIRNREQLLNALSVEVEQVSGQVEASQEEVADLEKDLAYLKEQYGNMIYQAYKNRSSYDKMMYLFAAESFNQAYKRMKLMQYYGDQRLGQADRIEESKTELQDQMTELQANLETKMILLEEQNDERSQLESDKESREQTLSHLKSREKDLLKQQQQAERERKKINDAIQAIIRKELEANRNKNNGSYALSPEGKIISENFEKNKGSLPWPVSRGVITSTYGKQPHAFLANIYIENKGVDISTDAGAEVFSVFDGEVTSVFSIPGAGQNIIVTHGAYKSVYTNLASVNVAQGNKVVTGQAVGKLFADDNKSTAHLEIWKVQGTGGEAQNPESWIVGH